MSRDCGSEAFGCNQSVVDFIKYHQDLSMISYCVYYDTVVKLNFISYIYKVYGYQVTSYTSYLLYFYAPVLTFIHLDLP